MLAELECDNIGADHLIENVVRHLAEPEPGKRDRRREYASRGLEALSAAGQFVKLYDGRVTLRGGDADDFEQLGDADDLI
jgi:hypothetical protein